MAASTSTLTTMTFKTASRCDLTRMPHVQPVWNQTGHNKILWGLRRLPIFLRRYSYATKFSFATLLFRVIPSSWSLAEILLLCGKPNPGSDMTLSLDSESRQGHIY